MTTEMTRRGFIAAALVAGTTCRVADGAATSAPADEFPLYAMDTGLRGPDVGTLESKVRALRDLKYWGIDYTVNHRELSQLLRLLDQYDVALACVYLSPLLEDDIDPKLADSIKSMKGRNTRIELAIRSRSFKSSDPAGDAKALDLLSRISDMASDSGPVVSIYPHTGLWTERAEDGARLARLIARKNVGTNFNLIHWKWIKPDRPLTETLKDCLPYLMAVSMNGIQGRTIVPLDEGDYDLRGFVHLLHSVGYRGPVGVQGFGIPGPSIPVLRRSKDAWDRIKPS